MQCLEHHAAVPAPGESFELLEEGESVLVDFLASDGGGGERPIRGSWAIRRGKGAARLESTRKRHGEELGRNLDRHRVTLARCARRVCGFAAGGGVAGTCGLAAGGQSVVTGRGAAGGSVTADGRVASGERLGASGGIAAGGVSDRRNSGSSKAQAVVRLRRNAGSVRLGRLEGARRRILRDPPLRNSILVAPVTARKGLPAPEDPSTIGLIGNDLRLPESPHELIPRRRVLRIDVVCHRCEAAIGAVGSKRPFSNDDLARGDAGERVCVFACVSNVLVGRILIKGRPSLVLMGVLNVAPTGVNGGIGVGGAPAG